MEWNKNKGPCEAACIYTFVEEKDTLVVGVFNKKRKKTKPITFS